MICYGYGCGLCISVFNFLGRYLKAPLVTSKWGGLYKFMNCHVLFLSFLSILDPFSKSSSDSFSISRMAKCYQFPFSVSRNFQGQEA